MLFITSQVSETSKTVVTVLLRVDVTYSSSLQGNSLGVNHS